MPETIIRPPWSPLSVTIITLLLPVGGVMLTIWNMQRLNILDRPQARRMTIGAVIICAVGLGIMFGIAPKSTNGLPQVDSNARSVLAVTAATICYFAQRQSFLTWRRQNDTSRTSSWINAIGLAVLFTVLTGTLSAPIWLLSQSLQGTSVGLVPL
jgi:hypothetical protein